MTTERDPRTRIVLSWLREETHENAERVLLRALDEVDTTPQRRSWWPAWRTGRMSSFTKLSAAAAARNKSGAGLAIGATRSVGATLRTWARPSSSRIRM